jgi:hypothetical protein
MVDRFLLANAAGDRQDRQGSQEWSVTRFGHYSAFAEHNGIILGHLRREPGLHLDTTTVH